MGDHARPRMSGRHRKPGMPARAAAATAAAATGTATAGVIILAGHASAAPVISAAYSHVADASTRTEESVTIRQLNTRLQVHLAHLRHLRHLAHLESVKENAQHVQVTAAVTPRVSYAPGVFSFAALKSLWESAGGPSWAAVTAACIAMHESGGRSWAVSPTDDFGLWQINGSHGAMATLNPFLNAVAAVQISSHGSNWGAWTTHWMCGV